MIIDLNANTVAFRDELFRLQAQEAECLYALNEKAPKRVTTEEIGRAIWGHASRPVWWRRKVSNYIAFLRRKIGKWGFEIQHAKGVGYRLKYTGRKIDPNACWLTRWSEEEKKELIRLHQQGLWPKQIAQIMGVDRQRVKYGIDYFIVCEARLLLAEPEPTRPPAPVWTDDRKEKLRKAILRDGLTYVSAAERFGTSVGAIAGAVNRYIRKGKPTLSGCGTAVSRGAPYSPARGQTGLGR